MFKKAERAEDNMSSGGSTTPIAWFFQTVDDSLKTIYTIKPENKTVSFCEVVVIGRSNDSSKMCCTKLHIVFQKKANNNIEIVGEPIVFEDFTSTIYVSLNVNDKQALEIQVVGAKKEVIDWSIKGNWHSLKGNK